MSRVWLARRFSLIFGMDIFVFLGGEGVNFCAGIFGVLLETLLAFFRGGGGLIFVRIRASP